MSLRDVCTEFGPDCGFDLFPFAVIRRASLPQILAGVHFWSRAGRGLVVAMWPFVRLRGCSRTLVQLLLVVFDTLYARDHVPVKRPPFHDPEAPCSPCLYQTASVGVHADVPDGEHRPVIVACT